MFVLRSCLFALATLAMIAGASGALSPLLASTALLFSTLAFACHPSSPLRWAVERGLHISVGSHTKRERKRVAHRNHRSTN